jgi:hypothetical protein
VEKAALSTGGVAAFFEVFIMTKAFFGIKPFNRFVDLDFFFAIFLAMSQKVLPHY